MVKITKTIGGKLSWYDWATGKKDYCDSSVVKTEQTKYEKIVNDGNTMLNTIKTEQAKCIKPTPTDSVASATPASTSDPTSPPMTSSPARSLDAQNNKPGNNEYDSDAQYEKYFGGRSRSRGRSRVKSRGRKRKSRQRKSRQRRHR